MSLQPVQKVSFEVHVMQVPEVTFWEVRLKMKEVNFQVALTMVEVAKPQGVQKLGELGLELMEELMMVV